MTTNYQNGKIYRITSLGTSDIYIGSTVSKLNKRLSDHIYYYNKYLNGNKRCYITSYEILKHGDYKIELIENYPCDNKEELHKKEQYYLYFYKDICVNKQKAYTGLTKIEYDKQKYRDNKEKILGRHKEYYEDNKDKLSEYKKEYYRLNKDKISEYNKEYRQNNRDEIAEKKKKKRQDKKKELTEKKKKKKKQKKIKKKKKKKEMKKQKKKNNIDKTIEMN